jgi:hypothetical protein
MGSAPVNAEHFSFSEKATLLLPVSGCRRAAFRSLKGLTNHAEIIRLSRLFDRFPRLVHKWFRHGKTRISSFRSSDYWNG